ncbi:protein kinase domain-containing protein [Streptomyces sp. NPDC004838]
MENTQNMGAGLLLAGRYRLGESIGRGGMGKVWRAHDEVLHRVVAVKELTAGMFASEADRIVLHARTQKEARAAARISHPGVVTVHDVLEHDARPWIVMQYVDGPSLADAAKESGRITPLEGARVGLHVLRALGAAHAAGVLHRDVKPANVLLSRDGRVLITDFGIAAIEGDATITRTGEIVGSIDYLAPERVRGGDPGPASDLWSLGATLYTAVEGQSPFRRSSAVASMQAVVSEEPPHPERAGPLADVIMALLRKDHNRRPPADEAERMLQRAREELEGHLPATVRQRIPVQPTTGRQPGPEDVRPDTAPVTPASSATLAAPTAVTTPTAITGPALPVPPEATAVQGTTGASGGTAGGGSVPAAPGLRGRRRLLLAAIILPVVAAGGIWAGFSLLPHMFGGTGDDKSASPGASQTASSAPRNTPGNASPTPGGPAAPGNPDASRTPDGSGDVPAGWRRVQDPAGFSLLVPNGWERRVQGGQIDYTPDGGLHQLRIGIDPEPDYDDPYEHALDLERQLQRLPDYQRLELERNGFRDKSKSVLWEFGWTERTKFPGARRGVDQLYFEDDGTEYALYMTGPAEGWAETREKFDIMLKSWRPTG